MSSDRVITTAELKKHNNRRSLWIAVHGLVYDITDFLEEHPGGEDVLLEQAGEESTEVFEDIGHSEEARTLMKKYIVGKYELGAPKVNTAEMNVLPSQKPVSLEGEANAWRYFVPVVAVVGFVAYKMLN